MRCTAGVQEFCAIRSYLAIAARHGLSAIDVLTSTLQGRPRSPKLDNPHWHQSKRSASAQ
jgi:hypothetical protein